jgi:predicted Zn-dependent protease
MVSGDAALARKQFRPALAWYSRASRIYPENRPALLGRIAMLGELKQFDKAHKVVTAARAMAPQDTDLLYYEAKIAADTKDWAKTRELLQPYETSLERMPAANALYAEALMRLGQEDQARVMLASQLLREPENRHVRMLLGEAKLATDDSEGALETLAPVAQWPDASAKERRLLAEAEARASGG